ncbi:hypothetical protein MJH12_07780 [bacterium]|nr:hypothetical protein [bacterium]
MFKLAQVQNLAPHIITHDDSFLDFDSYCAIEDLNLILQNVSIEGSAYFDSDLKETNSRKRIGFVFQGNPQHQNDHNRSIQVDFFKSLSKDLEADFVSLQVGTNIDFSDCNIQDVSPSISDFNDTSNLLQSLDLLISVDTSVLHLAGALGVKSWALIPFVPDWRWGLDQVNSHWYDSIQIIRQNKANCWKNDFVKLKINLKDFIENES